MKNNISLINLFEKELNTLKYPDSYRISREIIEYLDNNPDINTEYILNRLRDNEPWEYIRGYTEFLNHNYIVNNNVLIPRIETEQLVLDTIQHIKNKDIKNVIEVGTGTGCISISIKSTLPHINIYATDISIEALDTAKQNEINILKERYINWINTDVIKDIPNINGNTVLIANLPYIPTNQYLKLDTSVKDFEPRLALDGGQDGLDIFRKLFIQLKEKNLCIKGIFLETEESIIQDTYELVKQNTILEVYKESDLFNRDRFIYAY